MGHSMERKEVWSCQSADKDHTKMEGVWYLLLVLAFNSCVPTAVVGFGTGLPGYEPIVTTTPIRMRRHDG